MTIHTPFVEARVLKVTVTVQDRRSSKDPARGCVEVPWGDTPRISDRATSLRCGTLGYSVPGVAFPACVLCLARQRDKTTLRARDYLCGPEAGTRTVASPWPQVRRKGGRRRCRWTTQQFAPLDWACDAPSPPSPDSRCVPATSGIPGPLYRVGNPSPKQAFFTWENRVDLG